MKKAIAICMMVAALAPPMFATAHTQQTVPNGIARIGAAPTDTPADYSDVGVAIVDTGIDLANPDLNVVGGVDCTNAPLSPFSNTLTEASFRVDAFEDAQMRELARPEVTGYDDGHGHGTHVAGIVAAKDNGIGVVGVAPNASLYAVRVLDAGGGGTLDSIACGLEWVHENRDLIDVVNMSLGADLGENVANLVRPCNTEPKAIFYEPGHGVVYVWPEGLEDKLEDPMREAICDLRADGIPVVVAAGNGDGDVATIAPAAYPEVITVSSFVDMDGAPGGLAGRVDEDACPYGGWDDRFYTHHNFTPDQRLSSYHGAGVDFAAPGVCVLSTVPGGYMELTGTSMASPHVAGIVARLVGDHPEIAADGVDAIIEALTLAAETPTEDFRDIDDWAEPIARVVS